MRDIKISQLARFDKDTQMLALLGQSLLCFPPYFTHSSFFSTSDSSSFYSGMCVPSYSFPLLKVDVPNFAYSGVDESAFGFVRKILPLLKLSQLDPLVLGKYLVSVSLERGTSFQMLMIGGLDDEEVPESSCHFKIIAS
ncbi:hypothetical protein L1887_25317 [Cichorium endivia]|nr:hypothetical protein L1887_25317 [Cichorium endivia]